MHHRRLEWLRHATGETSVRAIARKVGRNHTTVYRWAQRGIPPEEVIRICVATNYDLLDALVEFGWLDPADRSRVAMSGWLESVPTYVLTEELHRRALHSASSAESWSIASVRRF